MTCFPSWGLGGAPWLGLALERAVAHVGQDHRQALGPALLAPRGGVQCSLCQLSEVLPQRIPVFVSLTPLPPILVMENPLPLVGDAWTLALGYRAPPPPCPGVVGAGTAGGTDTLRLSIEAAALLPLG